MYVRTSRDRHVTTHVNTHTLGASKWLVACWIYINDCLMPIDSLITHYTPTQPTNQPNNQTHQQRFNPESLEFLGKMLERSGINPHNAYTPPWLVNEPICMVREWEGN